jgi:hypothetical protein
MKTISPKTYIFSHGELVSALAISKKFELMDDMWTE